MKRILLLFSCLMMLCQAADPKKVDPVKVADNQVMTSKQTSTTKKNTAKPATKGLKPGNMKVNGPLDYYDKYYVISSAIFKDGKIEYLNDNHAATVFIYDEDYELVKTIHNAVTKEYFQKIDGTPIEIGSIKKRKNEQDSNFFGWYQAATSKWILPCKYSKIESTDMLNIVATTKTSEYKVKVEIYNDNSKKCYQTSSSYDGEQTLIYPCGAYYWIVNGEDTYEVCNDNLEWVRTVKDNNQYIYYETGKPRIELSKVFKKLKIKGAKPVMSGLCWPKDDPTFLCNIAPNDDCGYQETEDYILNKDYNAIYHQSIAGAGIYYINGYYICRSDGDFVDQRVYDKLGNQVFSKDGVAASDIVKTDKIKEKITGDIAGEYNFYGYKDGRLHIFTPEGEEVLAFPMEDKNSFDKYIAGQYGDIAIVVDYESACICIYHKNKMILQQNFDENASLKIHQCHRRNGDVVFSLGNRMICVTEDGKIRSNETIRGTIVDIFEYAYIVKEDGKMRRYPFPVLFEDTFELAGDYKKTQDHKYYVISDVRDNPEKGQYLENKVTVTPSVKILDENFKEIKTIPNAVARAYFQEVTGDTPIEIGSLTEYSKKSHNNYFGWYQPEKDQWLLPCRYEKIVLSGNVVYAYTRDNSSDYFQKVQAYNLKNHQSLQCCSKDRNSVVGKYGDYYWFSKGKKKYEIYDEDFNHIKTVPFQNDVYYYEDGSVRATLDDIVKALKFDYKNPKINMDSIIWPSDQNTVMCSIFEDYEDEDCYDEYPADIVINDRLEEIGSWSSHCEAMSELADFYLKSGEMYERNEIFWKDGRQVQSEDGTYAIDYITTKDGYRFIGYNQCDGENDKEDYIEVFNDQGLVLDKFHLRLSEEAEVAGSYGSILMVIDHYDEKFTIYYKDTPIYTYDVSDHQDEFRYDQIKPKVLQRDNGVVVVNVDQRILFITEDGKITSKQNTGGEIVELQEDKFLVRVNGHMKVVRYDDLN